MSKIDYIPFYVGIWSDKKFKSLPNSDCRILFIYMIGNASLSLTGIYDFDKEEAQLKTRLDDNEFNNAFNEVTSGQYNIEWDDKNDKIWVVNRFNLMPKSPKVIAGAIAELNQISHPFKQKFIEKYKKILGLYKFRFDDYIMNKEELDSDEFVVNASKIYSSKQSLKNFVMGKGISEEKIDSIISRKLPHLK